VLMEKRRNDFFGIVCTTGIAYAIVGYNWKNR